MKKLAILVPVKPLAEGKSRLQGILAPEQRAMLNRILALRTFEVAQDLLDVAEVFVVSKSTEVLNLASDSLLTRIEEAPSASLNEAIAQGSTEARRSGCKELLVLPVDLMFLTSARVRRLLENPQRADVLIVPDVAGKGTNLIYWRAIDAAKFHFGTNSALLHVQDAESRGLSTEIVNDQSLSFDLDSPADFKRWTVISGGLPNSGTYRASS